MALTAVLALLVAMTMAVAEPLDDSVALMAVATSQRSPTGYDEQLEAAFTQVEREVLEQVEQLKVLMNKEDPEPPAVEANTETAAEEPPAAEAETQDDSQSVPDGAPSLGVEEPGENSSQELGENSSQDPGENSSQIAPGENSMTEEPGEAWGNGPAKRKTTWEWCPFDGLLATLQSATSFVTSASALININVDRLCIPFEGKGPCLQKIFRIAEELLKTASAHSKAYGTCVMPGAVGAMPFPVGGGMFNPALYLEDPAMEAEISYCRSAAIDVASTFVIAVSDILSLAQTCFTGDAMDKATAFVNENCMNSKILAGISFSDDVLQAVTLAGNIATSKCQGVDSLSRQSSVLCRVSTLSSLEARFLSAARMVQAVDTCSSKASHTRAAVCSASLLKMGSTYYRLSKGVEYFAKAGCMTGLQKAADFVKMATKETNKMAMAARESSDMAKAAEEASEMAKMGNEASEMAKNIG